MYLNPGFKTPGFRKFFTLKFFLAMKLTALLLLFFCPQLFAGSYAQQITFSGSNVSLSKAFSSIEKQSGYSIFYKGNIIKDVKVSADFKNANIENAVGILLKQLPYSYTIINKTIVIIPRQVLKNTDPANGNPPTATTGNHQSAAIVGDSPAGETAATSNMVAPGTIRGKVLDSNGPLAGASVNIIGTSYGAMADAKGNYVIKAPPGTYNIVTTFVGYSRSELKNVVIASDKETVLNFTLTPNGELKEVMVSYGKQRQREVTGAISQLDASTVKDMPVGQFAQQMQGKIAGVQVSQVSGQPGRGMDFRIRGAASLTAGNTPLFVIDGLPITGSVNNINPEEIESLTVLKDASAAALYGSRADNGVILITTKHAKPGESKITLDSYYGVQEIPENKVPKMMDAQQYAQYMNERYQDAVTYEKPPVPPLNAAYTNPSMYGEGTDWFKVVTHAAPTQSYNLSILSSKDHSSSAVMVGYESQDGVLVNTGTQLFSLRINSDYSFINNKLKAGFNLAPSYRMDHNNRLTTDGLTGIFLFALEASPIGVPVNPDGSYPYNVNSPGMVTNVNPYAQLMSLQNNYNTTRILGNGYANYEITPGLVLKVNIGVDKGVETFSGFSPSILSSTGIATGSSTAYDTYSWTAETNLQYTKNFKDHHLEVLAGYSAEKYNSFNNAVAGQGFASDDVPYLAAATTITSGSTSTTQYSLLSAIGRINYSYKNKYLLSGAVRSDGSSRFGANKKYGAFPSVSAGWIVSDENFMKGLDKIDFLKVRVSYGITGNNNIGNYTYISSIGNNLNYFANGAIYQGATITTLGNDDLAWERNRQFDAGLDLTLLKNRISLTYDYYHKFTDGMIQNRPIPRASGFSTIRYNTGEFEFWGHEFTVNTANLTGKLKWNTSFNISVDRNVINSLVSPGYIDYGSTGASNYYRNAVGHPLGMFYGYVFDGLYKDAADLAKSAKYSGGSTFSDVGTIKFKDLNGDGVVEDVNDRTFIGDPTPAFSYGMTNNLVYKQFDLSISMAGQVGGKLLNVNKWTHLVNIDGARNLLADAADRWRSPSNPGSGAYPRTETNTTAIGRYTNSQWVENATYLTVKNIALGYTFKTNNKSAIKNLRVFGSIQQAFVITGYTGMTPEANLTGLDATKGIGIDVSQYPVPRTIALGVSASFK